jgi:phosphoserine phosphatase RsbU-like protein
MSAPVRSERMLFLRRYRAALLDYLLGSGEKALVRAHDLGRSAIDEGLGLLHVLRAHQRTVNAVLESSRNVNENLRRLNAAEDFLMETLSPFEMIYRGYVALVRTEGDPRRERLVRARGRHRRA